MDFTPIFALYGRELANILEENIHNSHCIHIEEYPARKGEHAAWPQWIAPALKQALIDSDISALYTHQVEAAEHAWAGENIIISTGTASGKSLSYLLPILTCLNQDSGSCALYITPTKALNNDQIRRTTELIREAGLDISTAAYDGDTPDHARAAIRSMCGQQSTIIYTTPEMLAASLLGNHQAWASFWSRLRYVVIDECHSYRGIFGAHMSLLIHRLRRVAGIYGDKMQFILASATSSRPKEHAELLTGLPIYAVTEDTSPRGNKSIIFWEPARKEEQSFETLRPFIVETASVTKVVIAEGARCIVFMRGRQAVEAINSLIKDPQVASYRSGYLPEDRRALETALEEGALKALISTNALELGIDIGGLDVVIIAGYPGTITSFWQQAGRAGRQNQSSAVIFIPRNQPLDNYLIQHPEALLHKPLEIVRFQKNNPAILADHLNNAACEKPLSLEDIDFFDTSVEFLDSLPSLRKRVRDGQSLWYPKEKINVGLRGQDTSIFHIVCVEDGRILGTIDRHKAYYETFPGAIYLHQGQSFIIEDLFLENNLALAQPIEPQWRTYPLSETNIRIVGAVEEEPLSLMVHPVIVHKQVSSYLKKDSHGRILDVVPLDLPEEILETQAVIFSMDPSITQACSAEELPGALHALEHAMIALLPLIATCDRWDLGGLSTDFHEQTLRPTIFIYDAYPGGAGFAEAGYDNFYHWLKATVDMIQKCPCSKGCPACIQSPKCGNNNEFLNKSGAITVGSAILDYLL